MNEKEKIFLTRKQAIEAINIDFKQYGSQFELFQELCPLITENRKIVKKEGRNICVLISRGRKNKIQYMTEQELGQYLVSQLHKNVYPLNIMAKICGTVFHTKSWPADKPLKEGKGIWLATEMEQFQCRQCGNCCRNLKYHNDCTEKDYRRWVSLNRTDILEKVMILQTPDNQKTQYKIWKDPGSGKLYPKCPWLQPSSIKGRYECRIHDVKPEYCRQYPLTRKHAAMTGCRGSFHRNN